MRGIKKLNIKGSAVFVMGSSKSSSDFITNTADARREDERRHGNLD